jgi:alkyl sulfatase BDS1-like metallo-beta-lactamase superfamily hydrolase
MDLTTTSKGASSFVIREQQSIRDRLPFSDTQDFVDASRGLVGRLQPCRVTKEDGTIVWDNAGYAFSRVTLLRP